MHVYTFYIYIQYAHFIECVLNFEDTCMFVGPFQGYSGSRREEENINTTPRSLFCPSKPSLASYVACVFVQPSPYLFLDFKSHRKPICSIKTHAYTHVHKNTAIMAI